MYNYKILTEVDPQKWNKELAISQAATFFQTVEYLTPSSGADYFAIFVYVLDENGNVVGQLGLRIIKTVVMYASPLFREILKIISKVTNRGIWVYGPIIHANDKNSRIEILHNILHAVDIISEKHDLVHVEGFSPPCDLLVDDQYKQELIDNGYLVNDYVTFIVDLTKSIDDIWKNVSKKARGDVNRAKRRNIVTKEVVDIDGLKEYLQLSQEWAKTKGLQITDPFQELERLWNNYKTGLDRFFLAYQDAKLISGLRVSCFNGIAITHSVVSSYSESTSLGGTLLTWYGLEASKNTGMKIYDFTGGKQQNRKNENIQNQEEEGGTLLFYKRKWGGDEFPHYNLLKIRKKHTYKLYQILFHLVQFYHIIKMRKYKKYG